MVGQVWRGGTGRQVPVVRLLAGMLLGRARTADVVDAALIVLSQDGDSVLTSDVRDLERLAAAAGVHIDLVPV